jgi:integrase
MPRIVITDRFVATIKVKTLADYFDEKTTGLGLRVSPAGVKSWSVMFTVPGSQKRARLSLGTYPATSLAQARTGAIEARSKVEQGIDPRSSRSAPSAGAMTVETLVLDYINKHAVALKTGRVLEQRLRANVLPVIGAVEVQHLHRRDIHRALDKILERGSPAMAKKCFDDLGAMVRWAVGRGYLDHDPTAQMEGPKQSDPRERFLTYEEIQALWPALPPTIAEPLKLSLITGQRIGEVCGMTADEVDLQKALWTIPAARTKNGYEHAVPLTSLALDLIGPRFEGRRFKLSAASVARTQWRRRGELPVSDWTAHDLRRTACTHMAMLGVSPLVIGAVVNHRSQTRSGVTNSTYIKYDYAREKREALELWGERLSAIVKPGAAKIIPLSHPARV